MLKRIISSQNSDCEEMLVFRYVKDILAISDNSLENIHRTLPQYTKTLHSPEKLKTTINIINVQPFILTQNFSTTTHDTWTENNPTQHWRLQTIMDIAIKNGYITNTIWKHLEKQRTNKTQINNRWTIFRTWKEICILANLV